MLAAGVVTVSLAAYCWPVRSAARRARALRIPAAPLRFRPLISPAIRAVLLAVGALGVWLVLGLPVAVTALLVGWTACRRLRARRVSRQRTAAAVAAGEVLSALVGCLRAGAHPAAAAEGAAQECGPEFARVLRSIAATSRRGGDVQRALAQPILGDSVLGDSAASGALAQLGRAWTLAQRHGLPLADVLEAVRRDLDHRVRFAGQVQAKMAGPRSSATVLAMLPCLGVALGEVMGAGPLHVLFATTAGQFLLLIGCSLTCGGLLWSARLTERTVRS